MLGAVWNNPAVKQFDFVSTKRRRFWSRSSTIKCKYVHFDLFAINYVTAITNTLFVKYDYDKII